jgi:hypothetical protein
MKRVEIYDRTLSLFKQLTKGFAGLYISIIQKVQLLSKSISTSHSPMIKFIHNKITTSFDISEYNTKYNDELLKASELVITDTKQQVKLSSNYSDNNYTIENIMMERKHFTKWCKALKNWIQFHRDSLLYLVVCLQENECTLESTSSDFIKFQDIYMRSTNLTQIYQRLCDGFNSFIRYIDEYLLCKSGVSRRASIATNRASRTASILDISIETDEDSTTNDEDQQVSSFRDMNTQTNSPNTPNRRPSSKSLRSSVTFKQQPQQQPQQPQLIQQLQKLQDDLSEFVDSISETVLQEQKVVFVSPIVKSANEKITKSLSVTTSIFNNIVKAYRTAQQLLEANSKVYSRGVICDYSEEIETSENNADNSYYADNNTGLSIIQLRAQRYLNLLTKKQSDSQDTMNHISLSEAKKNKKELEKLRTELKQIQEKHDSYQRQINQYQITVDVMKEDLSAFEKRFVECFVNWNMLVQGKNLPELPLFNNSEERDTVEQLNLISYIEKVDAVLVKTIDAFDLNMKKMFEDRQLLESQLNYKKMSIPTPVLDSISSIGSGIESPMTPNADIVDDNTAASQFNETHVGDNVDSVTDEFVSTILQEEQQEVEEVVVEERPILNLNTRKAVNIKPLLISKSENCTVQARVPDSQELKLFSPSDVHREKKLKEMYDNQIEYLMQQIEVCDLKAVEYRLQWQQAVVELEEASEREALVVMQLKETEHMLDRTQDELRTLSINYENQIQILSDNLAIMQHRAYMEDEEVVQTPTSSILSFFRGQQQ